MQETIENLLGFNPSLLHFIRPELLLAIPIFVAIWFGLRRFNGQSEWSNYIPKEMLDALQTQQQAGGHSWLNYLLVIWVTLILSAAGPTWVKQSVPAVKNQHAIVVMLDLSPSILSQDLKPSRLARAKLKLIDLIRKRADGQVALVAYAGDAYTVSPLSDDPRTIETLLPALHPSIMPSAGSNIEAAVTLSKTLLIDANAQSGELLIITDGIDDSAIKTLKKLAKGIHKVSILGVGSSDATPIPLGNGGFLRGQNGEIVLAKTDSTKLRLLANSLGGRFSMLSATDSDIDFLSKSEVEQADDEGSLSKLNNKFDAWADMGHLLILLLLPLALLLFRKGVIFCLPLLFIVPLDSNAAEEQSWALRDLWTTRNQQGQDLYNKDDYAKAAETFESPEWAAVAQFKDKDYDGAIDSLEGKTDPLSLYNKATSLAYQGNLKEAAEAYQDVLDQQPDHQDALHNKKVVKQLLDQQQEQKQQQEQSPGEQSDQNKQDGEESEEDQQGQSSEQESSQGEQTQNGEPQDESDPSQQQSKQDTADSEEESNTSDKPENASSEQQPNEDGGAESTERDDSETKASDEEKSGEQAESQPEKSENESEDKSDENAQFTEASRTPLEDSSEQWLRTIKDDPSGLLRRKFEYQTKYEAWRKAQNETGDKESQQEFRY